jgi:hypothetical protein
MRGLWRYPNLLPAVNLVVGYVQELVALTPKADVSAVAKAAMLLSVWPTKGSFHFHPFFLMT